ncbi:MAG: DUF2075 domain-containing protein [Bacilli bacterium]|jgi:DUF2075 family protein|nr:DUF2075 domain-containing protein [Bacilli bacterium]
MIVYSGNIRQFNLDVDNRVIADRIKEELEKIGINHNNPSEYNAWDQSLLHMKNVLSDPDFHLDTKVAIEYKLPTTSKRVDFLISGKDDNDLSKVIVIELKQWEKAYKTEKEDLVETFVGGNMRLVTHPSYQAYSYAKTIENFSEYVQLEKIVLHPCSYLHNYQEEFRGEIDNSFYNHIVSISPLFLKHDTLKLREFIKKYIKKPDDGEILYQIDHGKIRPSKALQDTLVSMLEGNEEYYMIDEQKVVYSSIKSIIEKNIDLSGKHTIIVEGGPGTGKSVVAINLLVNFRHLNASYVTKNSAPRNVYFEKLRRGKYKWQYVKNLFKSSGVFVDSSTNEFDCLFVDEAHRLNRKTGFFGKGENQIKEIINAAKISVFFIDENQRVTTKDIGTIDEIKKHARRFGSKIHHGVDFLLTSQFRCNGSEGYIAFLDALLGIRRTANYDYFDLDYDIRVYDDPVKMREDLRELNKINNKARMIAGYCYEWVTQRNPDNDLYDIELGDNFKAKWNFRNTNTWAIDETSFDQVGCIHTSQGLEFDYIGVIIGNDLRYENGKVITDYTKRAKSDRSLDGIQKYGRYKEADEIIRNTYKTLLTRGQKGCYIYCEDRALNKYLKERIELSKRMREYERNN